MGTRSPYLSPQAVPLLFAVKQVYGAVHGARRCCAVVTGGVLDLSDGACMPMHCPQCLSDPSRERRSRADRISFSFLPMNCPCIAHCSLGSFGHALGAPRFL